MTAWSSSASFICLKLVLAVSWTYVCRRLAPALSHGGSVLRGLSPNAQLLFKPQLVSCLLIFHWSKLVTWPSPKSLEEEIIQGHGDREMYFIGGLTITILPCPASDTFSQALVLLVSLFILLGWPKSLFRFLLDIMEKSKWPFWPTQYKHSWTVLLKCQLFCHSGAQWFWISDNLFSRKHLAIFGGIFGCHNSKCGRSCYYLVGRGQGCC